MEGFMTQRRSRVQIKLIPTGVPNLDQVLGGGFPAYSINVVAGPPGSGKTTLVQQILFNNAAPNQKALYMAALSEPVLKMLRYQQQFDFFDPDKMDSSMVYFDLGQVARDEGLRRTMEVIREQVAKLEPAFLALDSFKALEEFSWQDASYNVRAFIHDLGVFLAGWQVTSFLVGEYSRQEIMTAPEFSVADGILWLEQESRQNAVMRKLQVIKSRGVATMPGLHTFRINRSGILLFPRAVRLPEEETGEEETEEEAPRGRAAFGIAGLDEMLRGGIPVGETLLVAGSSGTGKTLLSLHFILEGATVGQPSVMVTFEENPREHERKARGFGWDLRALQQKNLLKMIYLRPMDLSVDEVLYDVHQSARELKAKRVVINSISGFEVSLAPGDRDDFREALYRLVATLSSEGITTLMTTEVPDILGMDVRLSSHQISFLADNVILLRYVEIESQLRKALMVVKMRTSDHDKELRQYQITDKGFQVEATFAEYSGVLSGIPTLRTVIGPQPFTTGLTEQEEALMHVLLAVPDSTVEDVTSSMGLKIEDAQRILDKLVDTGYVLRTGRGGKTTYRVTLVAPAVQPRRRK